MKTGNIRGGRLETVFNKITKTYKYMLLLSERSYGKVKKKQQLIQVLNYFYIGRHLNRNK